MSARGSLLEVVRALLERTYRIRSGLPDIASYVIGDSGLRQLYGTGDIVERVGSAAVNGARTLFRELPDGVSACVYFPDELIECLERYPPHQGLGEPNVDAFATFVEEIDHLLVVAERYRQERPVSMFELELHANVSKHLVLSRFAAGSSARIAPDARLWLQWRLFHGQQFTDECQDVRRRYEDATRWAVRLVRCLPALAPVDRLETLRSFHLRGCADKLALIRSLAA